MRSTTPRKVRLLGELPREYHFSNSPTITSGNVLMGSLSVSCSAKHSVIRRPQGAHRDVKFHQKRNLGIHIR